jgi:lysophospholipase L1-like esterase
MRAFWFFIVCIFSGCGSDQEPTAALTPVQIVYYGDSLVNQSGDRLQKLLPQGSTVDNKGTDAQMAYHAITGEYGSRLNYAQDKIYVLAWGANEALQNIAPSKFEGDLNHILVQLSGKKIVLESPPLIYGYDGTKEQNAIDMRTVVKSIGARYNVPVVDSVTRRDFVDGVHPTNEHYDERAKALADAIFKL